MGTGLVFVKSYGRKSKAVTIAAAMENHPGHHLRIRTEGLGLYQGRCCPKVMSSNIVVPTHRALANRGEDAA